MVSYAPLDFRGVYIGSDCKGSNTDYDDDDDDDVDLTGQARSSRSAYRTASRPSVDFLVAN